MLDFLSSFLASSNRAATNVTVMSSPGGSVSTHPISSLSPYQNKYVYVNITVCAVGHSELETSFVQFTVVIVNAVD
jgi:hypothetical protein